MKIVIAGSRSIPQDVALSIITYVLPPYKYGGVVCGMATGPDLAGRQWAGATGRPVLACPADWTTGKGAGMVRNAQMATVADALLALWDGQSKGTANMVQTALEQGLWVRVVTLPPPGLTGWANVVDRFKAGLRETQKARHWAGMEAMGDKGAWAEDYRRERAAFDTAEFDRQYLNKNSNQNPGGDVDQ
jgi:hypothetical protein